ncbi:DNA mismatch repair protein MutL [Sporosarcina sp. NCCP-2222]|uniref:DNA mismatch repair endonuclease MutL n=1 Tax=Sporosarcina sp. NCCP-2222 TaxID=2935073 RepID=UPI00207D8EB1|nr:DNA mismatch repair endonuclease MutL [Sporosarcina sp. NCCP-2222]GKV55514.1 DNA mismatch repair protein MutL [Sporosarcina sp. NCCP-2222]
MDIITVMDDALSNKIAAGEVVERPASIVKELVENAIDAGSTTIEIALEEAGLTSIRVTDNGKGMSRKDAVLAFERHATSKISNEHDLFRIRTLGFRGEALASIASVAKIQLWTSDGEVEGTEVQLEGGHVIKHDNAAFRKGTDIIVSQLFFNTPARLKYMKTIQTELGHTIDLVNRLALSHPHIAFQLMHENHKILQTAGNGDQRRVLAEIYSVDVARKMIPFKGDNADYTIQGFVTLPEMTRASKNYMTLIVNGRWVKSYAVNQAILDGMHTYLPIGRYPIAVINVEADPYLTDVNVHPSKQQIRVSKEGELLALIKKSIHEAIRNHIIIPDAIKKEPPIKRASEQTSIWNMQARTTVQQPASPEPIQTPSWPKKETAVSSASNTYIQTERGTNETVMETMAAEPALLVTEDLAVQQKMPEDRGQLVKEMQPENETGLADDKKPEKRFPSLVPVGQVHGTYIIAQNEDGFYMIDQHAAQERIKYEYFRDKVANVDHEERQLLLMPLIFHYSGSDKTTIEEHMDMLHGVGIFLEEFGPSSYTVREYPSWFPAGEETAIIEDIIEQVLTKKQINIGKLREESAIMMSCKKSIKANHYLTFSDMERLLSDLSKAENPYTCPHGRPVLIHFSTYEIEKMFKRVM